MYEYQYDELYRLRGATFGTITETAPTVGNPQWSNTFTQKPEYKLENIDYDQNGNLQHLKRYAAPINSTTAHLLDNLTYNYDSTKKNKLKQVGDAASNTAGYSADLDLPNQSNSSNYVYNSIGELIENKQEGLGYEYNSAGLVTRVYQLSTNNSLTEYTYNDKGLKYSKTSYSGGLFSVETEQLFYVYDAGGAEVATYKKLVQLPNDVYALQYHTLYGAGRVGLLDKSTGKALFELSDHLGNIRAVVTASANGVAETVSYTDYYSHGGEMPGRSYYSSLNFPYGYQGQEKDGATGLTNFELRQYDPRIGRWYNPDPYGQHHSPYLAMSNNPVSFTDPDGGWDGFGGSDDQWMAAHFAQMSAQNYFINGDADSHINGQENMALASSAYNEYRANHYNSELGVWGDLKTGTAHTTYGGETVSEVFVVDPKKKKENPVLFKLNQLNGGGLDFSGAKFNMSGYENLPWYKTKVDVFGTNAVKSAWNQAVDLTETGLNMFTSSGRKDFDIGVRNLLKGTMNWLIMTNKDQKVDDIIAAGTNVHNYENLAGSFILGIGIQRAVGIKLPFCFASGTKVWTEKGMKNIEDVRTGDIVFAYELETEKVVLRKVISTSVKETFEIIKLEYANEIIYTTPEHPFYVDSNWVKASQLKVGDLLFLHDKTTLPLQRITSVDSLVKVYNFAVENEHNYFVGKSKILVHNTCPSPRGLWKLTEAGSSGIKMHRVFGKIYKSNSDGFWWAVDNAGHGGSKFKVFMETHKGLEWIKDADMYGDFIMNKHKGPTGTFISWGELKTIK